MFTRLCTLMDTLKKRFWNTLLKFFAKVDLSTCLKLIYSHYNLSEEFFMQLDKDTHMRFFLSLDDWDRSIYFARNDWDNNLEVEFFMGLDAHKRARHLMWCFDDRRVKLFNLLDSADRVGLFVYLDSVVSQPLFMELDMEERAQLIQLDTEEYVEHFLQLNEDSRVELLKLLDKDTCLEFLLQLNEYSSTELFKLRSTDIFWEFLPLFPMKELEALLNNLTVKCAVSLKKELVEKGIL